MSRINRRVQVGCFLALLMMVSACSDQPGQASSSVGTGETEVSTATSTGETGVTVEAEASTTTTAAVTITAAETSQELPGDLFDIGPRAGDQLDVVNVRFDDVLNFRSFPDPSAPLVDTVAPRANSPIVISAGEGRLLPTSAWWRVTVDGVDAWANFSFLGMLGQSEDILSELVGAVGSDEAASLDELVAAVAEARAGSDPALRATFASDIEALTDGRSQVTVDLDGLADDAAKGDRLVLIVEEIEGDPDGKIRLVGASLSAICSRGLSDGRCV